jgi:predicted HTH transcriptional regulator
MKLLICAGNLKLNYYNILNCKCNTMNIKEFKELIAGGESTTVEFKRKISSPEKIAKEIVAFSNTKGGYLIVGVDDDGRIYGIESEKYEIEAINYCCQFLIEPAIEPNVQILNIKNKYLAVVYISESETKPHKLIRANSDDDILPQAYIRIGEKSVPASKEMTKILAFRNKDAKPLTIFIGEMEKRFFRYLEANEKATIDDFAVLVNISRRRARQIIVRLVRAGVLNIHCEAQTDYFTLV